MGKKPIFLNQSFRVVLVIALLFITLLRVVSPIGKNWSKFTEKFDPKLYEKKYNQSQWVIPNSKNVMSDEDLYSYSGFRYINGLNPILNSPEVPPLGKYLIGLSIVMFGNQRVISVITAVLSLFVLAQIVSFATKSPVAISLAIGVTSINSIFIDQIKFAPQLDIFYLLFLLLFFTFFLLFLKHKNKFFFIFSGISIGLFFSTKFFVMSFLIVNLTLLLFFLFKNTDKKKAIVHMFWLNMIASVVFLSTYIIYFSLGGNLRSFLGVQKWIFLFYLNSPIDSSKLYGSYLGLIFLNKWRYWSEGYPIISYSYWSVVWPITAVLSVFSIFKLWVANKIKNDTFLLVVCFLAIYNLFLFITPIYPRYLLLLFVPMNILIAIYFGKVIETKLK